MSENEEYELPEMFCPSCAAAVTEDTQKCPMCGDWITPVDRRGGGGLRRWVFVAAVVLMLLLTVIVMCPISIPVPRAQ